MSTLARLLMGVSGTDSAYIAPPGQVEWIGESGHDWVREFTVPEGVYSISILCVGAGGRGRLDTTTYQTKPGGSGGVGWANNIPVVPGEIIRLRTGGTGSDGNGTSNAISVNNPQLVFCSGNKGGNATTSTTGAGGTYTGEGGSNGSRRITGNMSTPPPGWFLTNRGTSNTGTATDLLGGTHGQGGGSSSGQPGAVRIIWPGDGRRFPNIRTTDE